jgi:hypothetical protein
MFSRSFYALTLFAGLSGCDKSPPQPVAVELVIAELTPHEKAARDFAFDRVTFATTKADIRYIERFIKEENLTAGGINRLYFKSTTATNVVVDFLEGEVVEIVAIYDVEAVEKLGGPETIKTRLEAKFGNTSFVTPDKMSDVWEFPRVDRKVSLKRLREGTVLVEVERPQHENKTRQALADKSEKERKSRGDSAKTGLE